jgi:hypothetical protein
MCWTNPKTKEKTDCGYCGCRDSKKYGNHKTKVSDGKLRPPRVYCTVCGEFLS